MENPCKIICFGDSVTKAYCSRFAAQIKKEYSDLQLEVINMGGVCETTSEGLESLHKVVAQEPHVVILGFGMNEWRTGVDKELFRKNLGFIVGELDRRCVRVIITTLNPDVTSRGRVSKEVVEYNEVIRQVAYEKRVRIADVYSLWLQELPNIEDGLHDGIHPNENIGHEIICRALMRVVPHSQTVAVWGFNGLDNAFCNYSCEYCYAPHQYRLGHHFQGDMKEWHDAFKSTFGNQRVVFYLAFGEPLVAPRFYDVLDMIAGEPNWHGHMTSNLSPRLDSLVETKLFQAKRFNINASFHPTQVSIDRFLAKLLLLREHGLECPVVLVMWPPFIHRFEEWFRVFNDHHFLVHVRRFRGWYKGKLYPGAYTEEERQFIARYCDDGTIKYMLNDFNVSLKKWLSYQGMYYALVDYHGDVVTSPDSKTAHLGNIFRGDVKLLTEPEFYGRSWNGSVNGVASLLNLNYRQLEGNFVLSFAQQGGVYHTEHGVFYKNMNTDFSDPEIRRECNFPSLVECRSGLLERAKAGLLTGYRRGREYGFREIYPRLMSRRDTMTKLIRRSK